ncbi:hypothetical protein [Allorhizocola rhizosphaerae]|uniref:hypothetical protein n=1 Tax=Allorhizocola rhizosphaerae TaxID=1872709 RepID=UPI0013C2CC32|nr:hypothetical protein [Allorhizocola rhizosphaerae]
MSSRVEWESRHPLAHVRQSRGWSLSDVARIVSCRSGLNMASWRQKVNRWERRGVVPEPAAQYALADELDVPRTAVQRLGWPRWLLTVDAMEELDVPWTVEEANQVLSRVMESAVLDRRDFLVISGHLFAAAAATSLLTLPEPVRAATAGGVAGSELLASLRTRVARLCHLDDALGGGACVEAAASDLRLVGTVLGRASVNGTTEADLYSVAASIARLAGFAAFDSGQHAAAQRFWHAGLRAAHVAGDRSVTVYLLSNLALQDIYVNQARHAIGMLDTARSNVDTSQKTVLAMLDCWQARAHAVRGEKREVATLLNRADDLYGRRRPGDDPEWIYWMKQPSLTVEAGTAMRQIGRPAHAQRLLAEGMTHVRDGATRDRSFYLARLAEAQCESGDLDQAADTARQALEVSPAVESARVSADMDAVLRRLPPLALT